MFNRRESSRNVGLVRKKFGTVKCLNLSGACIIKISFYSKEKLFDKNLFESNNVVLFIKHKHCFFIIN